jgi:EAL domain-containing protein (putative c-di-GMP-specific phosphodiesterase class I)
VPIGQWVVREACRQAREWQAAGLRPVPVAVNVSGPELRAGGFLDDLRRVLEDTGLDARFLELEVAESILMEEGAATADVLWEAKAMGLRLTVDDFGTGVSSLAYLTHFPVDALKIDQSFVRDVGAEDDESPVVTAMIAMGRSLKQRVIAEGVETGEQLAFLQARGCEEAQGFHFGRPMPGSQFAGLLASASRRVS